MNFLQNTNLGNWLSQLKNKVVQKIYQVDYREDRHDDIYLPWIFIMTFLDFNKYLEIEGDLDGSHIKINLIDINQLSNRLESEELNNDNWKVFDVFNDETLGEMMDKHICFVQYGIDKDEYEINGVKCKGEKDVFTFIKFNCDKTVFTIFEGGCGLFISNDSNIKSDFEHTFDNYWTNKKPNLA
jgi:hypothetical protein